MPSKVYVTGATGYVGRYLVDSLVKDGLTVYALSRRKSGETFFDPKVQVITGDITDQIDIPDGVGTVYHCAGVIFENDQMERVNVTGTQRIVEAALNRKCRLIHLSSAGVVGDTKEKFIDESVECNPRNVYETTKYKAENIVKNAISHGLKAHILRPTIIFGLGRKPDKDSFLQLVKAMKNGSYRNIGSGIYNIVHVNEVVRAMRFLENDNIPNGGVYFLNSPIAFKEMEDIVKSEISKTGGSSTVPYAIALCAAIVFTAISYVTGKRMPLTVSRLRALTNDKVYSQEQIIKTTSYKPLLAVEEYIRKVILDYKSMELLN